MEFQDSLKCCLYLRLFDGHTDIYPINFRFYHISPAAGSPTTTLLRLGPSYQPQINKISFLFLKPHFRFD